MVIFLAAFFTTCTAVTVTCTCSLFHYVYFPLLNGSILNVGHLFVDKRVSSSVSKLFLCVFV